MFETSDSKNFVKERDVKGIVERNIHTSKGDAGRLLIIGGSEKYVGSAVLAGLAALRSGVDSVMIAAPEKGARLMNAFSPDLMTIKLEGEHFYEGKVEELIELSKTASVVLIGPGIGVDKKTEAWLELLIPQLQAPVILDADATKQVSLSFLSKSILLGNKKEYALFREHNSIAGKEVFDLDENIFVVKGKEDMVMAKEGDTLVTGGHPRATVAGTGDVLGGILGALYAQGVEPLTAAKAACFIAKQAAERLAEKKHFGFLASDMVEVIPTIMKELRVFRITKYERKP
jgi:hydroxyethylthiazole kinase-like uncharacterized protein yjeF